MRVSKTVNISFFRLVDLSADYIRSANHALQLYTCTALRTLSLSPDSSPDRPWWHADAWVAIQTILQTLPGMHLRKLTIRMAEGDIDERDQAAIMQLGPDWGQLEQNLLGRCPRLQVARFVCEPRSREEIPKIGRTMRLFLDSCFPSLHQKGLLQYDENED